jgi:hypothetical protein
MPAQFVCGEAAPSIDWIGVWVGTRTNLDILEEKNLTYAMIWTLDCPAHRPLPKLLWRVVVFCLVGDYTTCVKPRNKCSAGCNIQNLYLLPTHYVSVLYDPHNEYWTKLTGLSCVWKWTLCSVI